MAHYEEYHFVAIGYPLSLPSCWSHMDPNRSLTEQSQLSDGSGGWMQAEQEPEQETILHSTIL